MNIATTFPAEAIDRTAALSRMVALCDESHAIQSRTRKLVDRLCPIYPRPLDMAWTADSFRAYSAALTRRDELHRLIKPRIAAKVRGRAA